jgi:hypothetical protein
MIDVRKAAEKIAQLGMLSFFPTEQHARAGVVALVCEMASDSAQVDWLVRRCLQLWSKWEGPGELRAVFCSKFRPRDGVEVCSLLPQFADGIPSERESIAPLLVNSEIPVIPLLAGETVPNDFPMDVFQLLREAALRRGQVHKTTVPTAADIAAIKATQKRNRNRKHSTSSPGVHV